DKIRRRVKILLNDIKERRAVMTDKRCSKCRMLFPEEELLIREDTGEPVCPDCSGLLAVEEFGYAYVEEG
ncbi:MAG: hypothetical protein P8Z70_00825, partial [Desulfuromonadales bacterium]